MLNEVVFNQVLVRFGGDETTERAAQLLREEGTCWASTSVWQQRTVLRISVSNWQTRGDDVSRSVASMREAASATKAG